MSETQQSTGDRLRAAATGQQVAKNEPKSFPQMLQAYKGQIAAALPKHINPDRMARIALTCFRQNPKLADCHPASVFASIIIGSQLGLEPGIMGQAYLVPYGDECQFVPGWRGLCDLVNRSGRASVWTGAVYQGDFFEFEFGSSPYLKHVPSGGDEDPEKLTHCYAIGRVKGAEYPVMEVWPVGKIVRHRNKYNKVGKKHYSYNNFEMYGRKVPLLQVLKYMPMSIELATALMLDQTSEMGNRQSIDLKDAIDAAFIPPPAQSESTDQAQPTDTPKANDKPPADKAESATRAAEPDFDTDDLKQIERIRVQTPAQTIELLKSAETIDALKLLWKLVSVAFKAVEIPISLEATFHDRKEFIEQRDAKAAKEKK
jgi:recombination protein RecT